MRIILLLLAAFAFAAVPARAASGVCLSGGADGLVPAEAGHCFALGEAVALLAQPVADVDGAPITLVFLNPADPNDRKSAGDCKGYFSFITRGWESESGADDARIQRFDTACGLRSMISLGHDPNESFLRAGDADLQDRARIAADILPLFEGDEAGPVSYEVEPGETLSAFVDRGGATVLDAKVAPREVRLWGGYANFREAARGDFNGDRIEDMAVLVSADPDGPLPPFSYVIGLTRLTPDGPLQRFPEDDQ